jgi:hypothetical protein
MTAIIGGTLFLLPAFIGVILLSLTLPNSLRGAFYEKATSMVQRRLTAVQRSLVCLLPLGAMGR